MGRIINKELLNAMLQNLESSHKSDWHCQLSSEGGGRLQAFLENYKICICFFKIPLPPCSFSSFPGHSPLYSHEKQGETSFQLMPFHPCTNFSLRYWPPDGSPSFVAHFFAPRSQASSPPHNAVILGGFNKVKEMWFWRPPSNIHPANFLQRTLLLSGPCRPPPPPSPYLSVR